MKTLAIGASYLLLALLLVGIIQAQVVPSKQVPLATAYVCTGVLEGKPYALALELTAFGDGFALAWVAQGQKLFSGFALRHRDQLAALSIDQRTGNLVLIAYRIEPGTLNGRWFAGDGVAHSELCLAGKPA